MLQVGDVDFDTAAGDDYNFVFAGVAEPDEVVAHGRPGDRRRLARRAPATRPPPRARASVLSRGRR